MTRTRRTTLLAAAAVLGVAAGLGGGFTTWQRLRVLAAIDEINSKTVSTLGDLDNNYRNLVLPVARISAKSVNSTQNGYGIEKMFDNNVGTKWEAKWSGAPAEKVFNFTFTQEETITGFYEITRNDNNIAGTMSTYKIETSADGNTWETAITNGVMPYELGTWNEVFDGAVTTKYLRFTTDAAAISEFRFYYIPSSGEDFQTLKAETEKLRGLVKQGDGFDVYKEDTFQKIGAGLTAAEAMPEETKEEIALKAGAYLDVLTEIKRGIQIQISSEKNYAEAYAAYQEAKTYYTAAQVGDQPLYWPQEAKDAFTPIVANAEEVFGSEFVEQGKYLDAVSELTRGYTIFQRAVIRPQIISDGFAGETNKEYLMDGLTENRWQVAYNNAANFNGSKWITFDYGSEVKIDGITLSCWWSVKQGIKSFRLEYWDGAAWKPMLAADGTDAGGVFEAANWTNNTNKTEYRNIKMKQQAASKFRFTPLSLMPGANNCTIDEFAFDIVTDPNDVVIEVLPAAVSLYEGGTTKLNTLILPHYMANKNVVWKSADESIATVDADGVVTAVSTGGEASKTVEITAATEYGNKSASALVTVLMKEIDDKDKQEVVTLYNIEKKFADAQTEEDYQPGPLKEYREGLAKIKTELDGASSLGQLAQLKESLKTLRAALDRYSLSTVRSVRALIDRIAGPGTGDKFDVQLIPAEEGTGRDVWEVDWNSSANRPVLRGNDGVSLATAFNYYLKYYCYQDFPYVATASYKIEMPKSLPKVENKVHNVFEYEYRHYFNVNCEYKYSAVNYGEQEWQRRVDWMAMNGYNMFLFDFDYRAVWLKMAQDGVLGKAFVKGEPEYNPAAMKELLTASVDKVPMFGEYAVSEKSVELSAQLGASVVEMAFELGIEPEIRPFYGALPFMFPNNHDDYYKRSKADFRIDLPGSVFDGLTAYLAAKWQNSPQGIALSPYTVASASAEDQKKALETFTYLSEQYYAYYMKVYPFDANGRTLKYVYKDLVEEQGFVIKHAAYPNKTLSYLEEQFQKLNPSGKWIVSSWTIQQWELDYFSVDKTLVIDLAGNKSGSTNEFWGTQWLWCRLNNYGGNQGLGHDLPGAVTQFAKLKQSSKNLSGFALGPEGSDTDPLYYDFMSELSWRSDLPLTKAEADAYIAGWMREYAKRRYGLEAYAEAPELFDEFTELLRTTFYSATPKGAPEQSVINGAPKLSGTQARPNADTQTQGWSFKDASELFGLTAALVNTIGKENQTPGFLYDMTDVTRQILSELAQPIYKKIDPAYSKDTIGTAKAYTQMIIDIIYDMDELLASNENFLFGSRVEGARSRGATEADAAYYEVIERTFVTYWMADNATPIWAVYDYANKQLAGYLKDWCAVRWEYFYNELDKASKAASFPSKGDFNKTYQARVTSQTYDYVTKWVYEPYNTYYNARKDTENLAAPYYPDANAVYTSYATETTGDNAEIITRLYKKYASLLTEMYQKTNNTDKSALEALYKTAEEIERNENTGDAEWADFTAAKEYAQAVIENANAEKGEVRVAEIALKNAIGALSGDDTEGAKLDLQTKYARYSNVDTTLYTDESAAQLRAALERAKGVLDKAEPTLREIIEAGEALESAYAGLKMDLGKGRALLEAERNRLSALEADGYTYASYKRLTDALQKAAETLENAEADAAEIQSALDALTAAEEGLEKAEIAAVDKTDLQTVYDMCAALTEKLYTKESWESLAAAYADAKAALENADASQQQVNAAKDALTEAWCSLEVAKESGGGGCKSSVAGGSLFLAAILLGTGALAVSRRRREER